MARANRGAAAAAAADNVPAAAGAGAPAGPSAIQTAAAALSELTAPQFVARIALF